VTVELAIDDFEQAVSLKSELAVLPSQAVERRMDFDGQSLRLLTASTAGSVSR
jgi:hypothetical protein